MSEVNEKVIILTGASRGLGLAIAHHLLSLPTHKLVVLARTRAALDALLEQYGAERVEVVAGDLSDFSLGLAQRAVEVGLRRWGRVDGLIVNHGSLEPVGRVGEGSVEAWRRAFDVNVFSAVALIQAALPPLRTSAGRIILISSGASIHAYPSWGPYGASKATLNHLAATLGAEEPAVTSVAIRPGVVDTQMQREIREVHAAQMSEVDVQKFRGLKEKGELLRAEVPGGVVARLAVGAGRELSGRFLSWNDEALGAFQAED